MDFRRDVRFAEDAIWISNVDDSDTLVETVIDEEELCISRLVADDAISNDLPLHDDITGTHDTVAGLPENAHAGAVDVEWAIEDWRNIKSFC